MSVFGNIIWFICGGFFSALSWLLAACPFGKEIVYGGGAGSLILNIFWMILTGIPMALESLVMGVLLCITIIGIPFGLQHFKMAKLALMPFGSQIIYT